MLIGRQDADGCERVARTHAAIQFQSDCTEEPNDNKHTSSQCFL
jgi:hypothetical protein